MSASAGAPEKGSFIYSHYLFLSYYLITPKMAGAEPAVIVSFTH